MGDHNNYVLSQAPVLHLPAAPVLGGALPIPQHSQGSVPPTPPNHIPDFHVRARLRRGACW